MLGSSDFRIDITGQFGELRSGMSDFRTDLRTELTEFRTDLSGQFSKHQTAITSEIGVLRSDLTGFKIQISDQIATMQRLNLVFMSGFMITIWITILIALTA